MRIKTSYSDSFCNPTVFNLHIVKRHYERVSEHETANTMNPCTGAWLPALQVLRGQAAM